MLRVIAAEVALRVTAAVLALLAVICMTAAIVGMVTGRPGAKMGWVVRALALVFFATAVALNVAAH
jgi:hypothetical protein